MAEATARRCGEVGDNDHVVREWLVAGQDADARGETARRKRPGLGAGSTRQPSRVSVIFFVMMVAIPGVHDSMAASGQSDSKGCTGGKCRVAIDGVNYKSLASTHVRKVERQILQDSGECSRDCSGHGSCTLNATTSGQSCQCEAGWDPQMDCQSILNCTSLSGCSGHGICVKGGKCACDPGWSGPACSIASCPKNCSGHGTCNPNNGKCVCDTQWDVRPSCSVQGRWAFGGCASNCTNGACVDGVCECNPGFTGSDCAQYVCINKCSGHGVCRPELQRCDCSPWFTGEDCSFALCPFGCSGHGACVDGVCSCDAGFGGYDCSFENCPDDCSGHGTCEVDGTCTCQDGYSGSKCNTRACIVPDCSGHGSCMNATCICDIGFAGHGCEITDTVSANLTCPQNCTGHGTCAEGSCNCDHLWTGVDCSVEELCRNDCSGHGSCNNGTCACDFGWDGMDCSSLNPITWCQHNCTSGSGIFLNGTCLCLHDESRTACANNCSGHGSCSSSPYAVLSPDTARTPCAAENMAFDDALVLRLKTRDLTQVVCPFGVPVVGHKQLPQGYLILAANILAALLDKDSDSIVDNIAVLRGLKDQKVMAIGGISEGSEDVEMGQWKTFGLQTWKVSGEGLEVQRTIAEEIFHMITQWGWGLAFPEDVGTNDFSSSVACREMQRVACSNPGWMHPENKCPGATGSPGDYSFPPGHTYREPGSAGLRFPLVGGCSEADCDCVEFFHQAALVYVGAEVAWSGREMPKSQVEMRSMLSASFKAMMDQGRIITDKRQVSGSYGNSTCFCDAGFSGIDCSGDANSVLEATMCLGNCSGHGSCSNGTCACDEGWAAEDCSVYADDLQYGGCPSDCTGHGACTANSVCICDVGYLGSDCSLSLIEVGPCAMNCSGHGACSNGTCLCDQGFMGAVCEMTGPGSTPLPGMGLGATPIPWLGSTPGPRAQCVEEGCSGHGTCVVESGLCFCDPGYYGSDCESYMSKECPRDCSQHGICVYSVIPGLDPGYTGEGLAIGSGDVEGIMEARCLCDLGWGGLDCSLQSSCGGHSSFGQVSAANCSGHGLCQNGTCVCDFGWEGESCANKHCPNDCSGRGICANGTCACDFGWRGADCTSISCPNDCSGHGSCSSHLKTPTCMCDASWAGADCAMALCPTATGMQQPYSPCSGHGACTQNGTCICYKNYAGDDCNTLIDCSGRGIRKCGFCECEDGFRGTECEIDVCADSRIYDPLKPGDHRHATVCTGHGKCMTDRGCVCSEGAGRNCSMTPVCPDNCNARGKCVGQNGLAEDPGQCLCDHFVVENSPFTTARFSGPACETEECPGRRVVAGQVIECSGKGKCMSDKRCNCFTVAGEGKYTGDDCGIPPVRIVSDINPKVGPVEGGTVITVLGPGLERVLVAVQREGSQIFCFFQQKNPPISADFFTDRDKTLAAVGPITDTITCKSPPVSKSGEVSVKLLDGLGVPIIDDSKMIAQFEYFVQTIVTRVWPSFVPLRPNLNNGQRHPELRRPNSITVTGTYFPPNGQYVCQFRDCSVTATRLDQANIQCEMPRLADPDVYPMSVSSNAQQFSTTDVSPGSALTVYGITSISPSCASQQGIAVLTVAGKHLVDKSDLNRNPNRFYCRFGFVTEKGATKPEGTSPGEPDFLRFSFHSRATPSNSIPGALECKVPGDTVDSDYFSLSLDAEERSSGAGDSFWIGQWDSNPDVRFQTYYPPSINTQTIVRTGLPLIYRMTPTLGGVVGGTRVTIKGEMFDFFKYNPDSKNGQNCEAACQLNPSDLSCTGCSKAQCNGAPIPACSFGMSTTTEVDILDKDTLVCITPALIQEISQNIMVTVEVSLDGQTFSSSGLSFQYNPTSTVISVKPTAGVRSGGTPIVIYGTNFVDSGDASIPPKSPKVLKCVFFSVSSRFDDDKIIFTTEATFLNPSMVQCLTPDLGNSVPGAYTVDVSLSGQTDFSQLAGSVQEFYFYQDPKLIALEDPIGSIHGGETVDIVGENFQDLGNAVCKFGETIIPANHSKTNPRTRMTCVAPVVSAPTTVQVSISMNGVDFTSDNVTYVFYELTDVSPSSGPIQGGTWIELTVNGGPSFNPLAAGTGFDYRMTFGRPGIERNEMWSGLLQSSAGGIAKIAFFIKRYTPDCGPSDTKGCTNRPIVLDSDEYPAAISMAFTSKNQLANFEGKKFMFYGVTYSSVLPCEDGICKAVSIPKDGMQYAVTFTGTGLVGVSGIKCAFYPIKSLSDLNSWDNFFTARNGRDVDFRSSISRTTNTSMMILTNGTYDGTQSAIGCFAPRLLGNSTVAGYVATVALNGQNFDHEVFQVLYLQPPRVLEIQTLDGKILSAGMSTASIPLKIVGSGWAIADSIGMYALANAATRVAGDYPKTLSCVFYAPMSQVPNEGIHRFVQARNVICNGTRCEATCLTPTFSDIEMDRGILFTQVFLSMNRRDPCLHCGCEKIAAPVPGTEGTSNAIASDLASRQVRLGEIGCVANMQAEAGWDLTSPVSSYNSRTNSFCNNKQLSHVLFCGHSNGCHQHTPGSLKETHACHPGLSFSNFTFISPPVVKTLTPANIGQVNNQTIQVSLSGHRLDSMLWKSYPDAPWSYPDVPSASQCASYPSGVSLDAIVNITYLTEGVAELSLQRTDVKYDVCGGQIRLSVPIPCSLNQGDQGCFDGPFAGTNYKQTGPELQLRFAISLNDGLQFVTADVLLRVYLLQTVCPSDGCGHGTCVKFDSVRSACVCGVFTNPDEFHSGLGMPACARDGRPNLPNGLPYNNPYNSTVISFDDQLPDWASKAIEHKMVGVAAQSSNNLCLDGGTDCSPNLVTRYQFCPLEDSGSVRPECSSNPCLGSTWDVATTHESNPFKMLTFPTGSSCSDLRAPGTWPRLDPIYLGQSVLKRGSNDLGCSAGPTVDRIWPTLGSAAGGTTVTLDMNMWWYPEYSKYPWQFFERVTDTWGPTKTSMNRGPKGENSAIVCTFRDCNTSQAVMLNPDSIAASGKSLAQFHCAVPAVADPGVATLRVSLRNKAGDKSPLDFTGEHHFVFYKPPVVHSIHLMSGSTLETPDPARNVSAPMCHTCQAGPEGRSISGCQFPSSTEFLGADCPEWSIQANGTDFIDSDLLECRFAFQDGNSSLTTKATWISSTVVRCAVPKRANMNWKNKNVYLTVTLDGQVYTSEKHRVELYPQPTLYPQVDDSTSAGGFGVDFQISDNHLRNLFGVSHNIYRESSNEPNQLKKINQYFRRAPTKGGTPLALFLADACTVCDKKLSEWKDSIRLMFSYCPAPATSTSHRFLDQCSCETGKTIPVMPGGDSMRKHSTDPALNREVYKLKFLTPSMPEKDAGDYLVCLAVNGLHFAPLEEESFGSDGTAQQLYRVGFTFYRNPSLTSLSFKSGPIAIYPTYRLDLTGANFLSTVSNVPRYPYKVHVLIGGLDTPPNHNFLFNRVDPAHVTVSSASKLSFPMPNMTQAIHRNFKANISVSFNGYDFTRLEAGVSEFLFYSIPSVQSVFPQFGHRDFPTAITVFGKNFQNNPGRTKCMFEDSTGSGRVSDLVPATYINDEQMRCTIVTRLKGQMDDFPVPVDSINVKFTSDGSDFTREANPSLFASLLVHVGQVRLFDDVPNLNLSTIALPIEGGVVFPITIQEEGIATKEAVQDKEQAAKLCLDFESMAKIHPEAGRSSLRISILPTSSTWDAVRPDNYEATIPTVYHTTPGNLNAKQMVYISEKDLMFHKWSCVTIIYLTSPVLPFPMLGSLRFSYNDGQKFVGPSAMILFYRTTEPISLLPLRGSKDSFPRPRVTSFFTKDMLSGASPAITSVQAGVHFTTQPGCQSDLSYTCEITATTCKISTTGTGYTDSVDVDGKACCNPQKVMVCPTGPKCSFATGDISTSSPAEFAWGDRLAVSCVPTVMPAGFSHVNILLDGISSVQNPTRFYFYEPPKVQRVLPSNCLFDTETRLRVTGTGFLQNDPNEVQMWCIFDFKNVTPAADVWFTTRFWSRARYVDTDKIECNAPRLDAGTRPSVPKYPRAQVGVLVDGRCSPTLENCQSLLNSENPIWSDGFVQYTDRPKVHSIVPSTGMAGKGGLVLTIDGDYLFSRANYGKKSSWNADSPNGYSEETFKRLLQLSPPSWGQPEVFGPTCKFGNYTTQVRMEVGTGCVSPSSPCAVTDPRSRFRCPTPNITFTGVQVVDVQVSLNAEASEYSNAVSFIFSTPEISKLTPVEGTAEGGGRVSISGDNFVNVTCPPDAALDSYPCLMCEYSAPTAIKRVKAEYRSAALVVCPVLSSREMGYGSEPGGTFEVSVSSNGVEFTTERKTYTYTKTIVFKDFEPLSGPVTGNTTLTVHGEGFEISDRIKCRFGSARAENPYYEDVEASFVSSREMQCKSPAWTTTVMTGGVFLGFSSNDFDFCELLPVNADDISLGFNCVVTNSQPERKRPFYYHQIMEVQSISPPAGMSAGGTEVHITGTGFAAYGQKLNVYIGENNYRVSVPAVLINATTIKFEAPKLPEQLNVPDADTAGEGKYYILDKAYPVTISSNNQQFTQMEKGDTCPEGDVNDGNRLARCTRPFVMFTWYTNPQVMTVRPKIPNFFSGLSTPLYNNIRNFPDIPQGPVAGGTIVTLDGSDFTSLGRPRIDGGIGVSPALCSGDYDKSPCYTTCNFPFVHAIQGSQFYYTCINLKRTSEQQGHRPDQYWCSVGESVTFANQYGVCETNIARWKDFSQGGKYVTELECRFGEIHVPATVIDNATISCASPPFDDGIIVPITVTMNRKDYSRVIPGTYFQYIKPAPKAMKAQVNSAFSSITVSFSVPTNLQGLTASNRVMKGSDPDQSGCSGLFQEEFLVTMGSEMFATCVWSPDNTSVKIDLGRTPTFNVGDDVVFRDNPCEQTRTCREQRRPTDLLITPYLARKCAYPQNLQGCDQMLSQSTIWCGRCIPINVCSGGPNAGSACSMDGNDCDGWGTCLANDDATENAIAKIPAMDLSYPFNHSTRNLKIQPSIPAVPMPIITGPSVVDNCKQVCFGGPNDGQPCSTPDSQNFCGDSGLCRTLLVELSGKNSFGNAGKPFTLIEWGLDQAHSTDMGLAANMSIVRGKLIARLFVSPQPETLNIGEKLVYCFTLKLRNWLDREGSSASCHKVELFAIQAMPSLQIRTRAQKNAESQYEVSLSEKLLIIASGTPTACASNASARVRFSYSWSIEPVPVNWNTAVIANNARLNLDPSLEVGFEADTEYRLSITAVLFLAEMEGHRTTMDLAVVFRQAKPVPMISGGSRTVSLLDDLVLDASSSFLPGKPGSDLSFCWSCLLSDGTTCEWPAEGSSTASWIIKKEHLKPGIEYETAVRVKSGSVGCPLYDNDTQVSSGTVLITTSYSLEGLPDASIYPRVSQLVDRTRKLRVSGYVSAHDCPILSTSCSVNYRWEFDPAVPGHDTSPRSGFGLISLVLDENMLFDEAGRRYTIRLVAYTSATNEATSEMTAVVNVGPGQGSFEVSPTLGRAMETQFNLVCSGWQDEQDHLPLEYEFRTHVYTQSSADPLALSLGEKDVSSEIVTVLPAGDPSNDDRLHVEAVISDIYGASVTKVATVAPKVQFTLDESVCQELVKSARRNFDAAMDKGDMIASAQQLSLFGGLLGHPEYTFYPAGSASLASELSDMLKVYYPSSGRRRSGLQQDQSCDALCVKLLGQNHLSIAARDPEDVSKADCEAAFTTIESLLGVVTTGSQTSSSDADKLSEATAGLLFKIVATCQHNITTATWGTAKRIMDYTDILYMKGKATGEGMTFESKHSDEKHNFYHKVQRLPAITTSSLTLELSKGVQTDKIEVIIPTGMEDPGGNNGLYDIQLTLFGKGVNPYSSVANTATLNSRMVAVSLRQEVTSDVQAKNVSNYGADKTNNFAKAMSIKMDAVVSVDRSGSLNQTSGVYKSNVCASWDGTKWVQFGEKHNSENGASIQCETDTNGIPPTLSEFAIITGFVGCDHLAKWPDPAVKNECLECGGGDPKPGQGICDYNGIPCLLAISETEVQSNCPHLLLNNSCPKDTPCCLDKCKVCGGQNKPFTSLATVNNTGLCDFAGNTCTGDEAPSVCGVCRSQVAKNTREINVGICDCANGGTPGGNRVLDRCGHCCDPTGVADCSATRTENCIQPCNHSMDYCGHNAGIDQEHVCHTQGPVNNDKWNASCTGCDGVPRPDLPWRKTSLRWDVNQQCKQISSEWGSGGLQCDACGKCGGDGKGCVGCDGVPDSGKQYDACKVCGDPKSSSFGASCKGCDGVPRYSPTQKDACGECGGKVFSMCDRVSTRKYYCNISDYQPHFIDDKGQDRVLSKADDSEAYERNKFLCKQGCDGGLNSGKTYNKCGKCGQADSVCLPPCCDNQVLGDPQIPPSAQELKTTCVQKNSEPPTNCWSRQEWRLKTEGNGGKGTGCEFGVTKDRCGKCGGDNSTCLGCDRLPFSGHIRDICGQCDGDGSSCSGCDGVPNSGLVLDFCKVCNGGNVNRDVCGKCVFPPDTPGTSCAGCDGKPHSGKALDACGVCGGSNTCKWRDGDPPAESKGSTDAVWMDVPLAT